MKRPERAPKKESHLRNFQPKCVFLALTTMTTPNEPEKNLPPEEFELSQDKELWELLAQKPAEEAGPLFSRNVLREIRLQDSKSAPSSGSAPSLWSKLLEPRVLFPAGLAALALIAAFNWNSAMEPRSSLADATNPDAFPVAVATSMEDSLESELLLAAADTPSLFSDEEVVAMLF